MRKPKSQALHYRLQLIEWERLAVAKRTEDRIATMQKEAKERPTTGAYFYVLLTFCLFVLVLNTNYVDIFQEMFMYMYNLNSCHNPNFL
jgi:hypothetical protein